MIGFDNEMIELVCKHSSLLSSLLGKYKLA